MIPLPSFPYTGEIGGITFGSIAPDGSVYALEDVDGWDSPTSTGQVSSRTYAHGGWATKAFFGPKPLTLTATVIVAERDRLDALIDELLSAIPLDEFGPLTVTRDGLSRVSHVRQDGEPTFTVASPFAVRVQIPLIAADPFRYGATTHSRDLYLASTSGGLTLPFTVPFTIGATVTAGSFVAANAGSTNAPVKAVVYGPVDTPTLTNVTSGQSITYGGVLAAGEFVEIDLARRSVLLQGQSSRRGLVSGSFWDLAEGDSEISFTAAAYNASAHVLMTWRDTWK